MWRGVVWAMVVGGLGLACGGRYEHNPRESDAVDVGGNVASGGTALGGLGGGGLTSTSGTAGTMDLTCSQRQSEYQRYYAEVMAEFEDFPCEVDEDCRSYYLRSPCDPTCRLITSAAHRGIIDRLNSFGGFNCNTDCFPDAQDCPKAPPVHCIERLCQ